MARHNLFSGKEDVEAPEDAQAAIAGTVRRTSRPAKGEAELMKTSLYISRAVHEKLREIAFTERKNINDLVLEGLDSMLKKRSYPTTEELTRAAKTSQR